MRISEVEFTVDEKQKLRSKILELAKSDTRVFNKYGFEWSFENETFPFIGDMEFGFKIRMFAETEDAEPPDTYPIKIQRVSRFDYYLMQDGEEVGTNLDWEFQESIVNELTI